jgi:hypothetical protein
VRSIAAVGAAALAASSSVTTPVEPPLSGRTADVTVIYVGADDCAPCRTWRRESWPKFRASGEFVRVAYREVTSPKLFDLLQDEHWPPELRDYRGKLDRTAGVPLWLVVASDEVVLEARGVRQWEEKALPAIKRLVR